jgi:hypothetical protein
VIECDVAVPAHLKEHFAEMPPIFKNTEIQYKDLSGDTKAEVKPNYKSKKLIGLGFFFILVKKLRSKNQK